MILQICQPSSCKWFIAELIKPLYFTKYTVFLHNHSTLKITSGDHYTSESSRRLFDIKKLKFWTDENLPRSKRSEGSSRNTNRVVLKVQMEGKEMMHWN